MDTIIKYKTWYHVLMYPHFLNILMKLSAAHFRMRYFLVGSSKPQYYLDGQFLYKSDFAFIFFKNLFFGILGLVETSFHVQFAVTISMATGKCAAFARAFLPFLIATLLCKSNALSPRGKRKISQFEFEAL